jgi:hypothetical protein
MYIPNINFKYWLGKWNWEGTHTVYTNKNLKRYSDFNGSVKQCSKEIIKLVSQSNLSDAEILKVIDLINHWGGKTSRQFYSRNKKNNFLSPRDKIQSNLDIYKKSINLAKTNSEKAFSEFCKIESIGPSFSGKHAMFWSKYNLIILDNKIAGCFGYTSPNQLLKNHTYKELLESIKLIMINNKLSSPTDIERALFCFHNNFFLNDNKGWKTHTDKTDYNEALRISKFLKLLPT